MPYLQYIKSLALLGMLLIVYIHLYPCRVVRSSLHYLLTMMFYCEQKEFLRENINSGLLWETCLLLKLHVYEYFLGDESYFFFTFLVVTYGPAM